MSLIDINKEVAPILPLMSKISECSSEAAKFYTLACRAAIVTEIIKISEGNQDLRFHTTGIADITNHVDDDGGCCKSARSDRLEKYISQPHRLS